MHLKYVNKNGHSHPYFETKKTSSNWCRTLPEVTLEFLSTCDFTMGFFKLSKMFFYKKKVLEMSYYNMASEMILPQCM